MAYPRALIPVLIGLTMLALPGQSAAQDATPTVTAESSGGALICTAEPRDLDELLALWFDAEGKPAATPAMAEPVDDARRLPEGGQADAAIVSAIDQVTREWIVCLAVSGEYARAYSYLTDDLIAMLGPDRASPDQDTPEEVRALMAGQLAGTPIPGDGGMDVLPVIEGPDQARNLPEGRIGALWAIEGDRVFLVYEQVGGRWLIDELIDVLE